MRSLFLFLILNFEGLRASTSAQVRISDSIIRKNNNSGVTALPGANVNITRTNFNDNVGGDYGGGAIYSQHANILVQKSKFTRNIGSGKIGGALLCSDKSSCILESCEFSNPMPIDPALTLATKGAAITVDRSHSVIRQCLFEHLHSTTGGALSVSSFGTVKVIETVFRNNQGSEGSAIYMEDSTVHVLKSTFEGNIATYDGGAMRVSRSSLILNDTKIRNNEAGSSGGGVALSLDGKSNIKSEWRASIAYMEKHCSFDFYFSPLFQTYFIVLVTYLLYSKTPIQVFFLTQ